MKKPYLIIACFLITILLQAQVSKTVNVTAGGLSSAMTATEKSTITNLTLTGTIDARDFKTMRDDMPVLTILDLGAVAISEYTGTEGTMSMLTPYESNLIPHDAFHNQETTMGKASLTSVTLPKSVTAIGLSAFLRCSGLTSVNIPPSVIYILSSAFGLCTSLKSVTIPSSVTTIQDGAFRYCSALTSVTVPSSVTSIESTVFSHCTSLKSVTIPSSVTSIGVSAFLGCSGLTSLIIPSSVNTISSWAFKDCTGLSSIALEWTTPLNISSSSGVFEQVNKTTCILHVPLGSETAYQTANQWKDFGAPSRLDVSSFTVNIAAAKGSATTIDISTNVNWTASSDQSWLMVSPSSGNGDTILTFTAEANTSATSRIALVTIAAIGLSSQIIEITQLGNTKTIVNTAGGLMSSMTVNELNSIANLTISGTIDARDFTTMRDNMPELTKLDLSSAIIVGYQGWDGSAGSGMKITYPENAIPQYAFCTIDSEGNKGKNSLTSVKLPLSLTSISSYAFLFCTGLNSIIIPESVISIGRSAFNGCTKLESVTINPQTTLSSIGMYAFRNCIALNSVFIPSTVKYIGERAFSLSSCLINVDVNNTNYSSVDGVLYNKDKTTIIRCPISKAGNFIIPSSVNKIEERAFQSCKYLTSVDMSSSIDTIGIEAFLDCAELTSFQIPASIKSLGAYAFYGCLKIYSVYIYSSIPVCEGYPQLFDYGETRLKGTLYVPFGSKDAYQSNECWDSFANIVEFDATATDIKSINILQVSIYPNPVTNGFSVTGIKRMATLSLYDGNGKLLLTKIIVDNEYISTSSLTPGIYFVRITSKAGTFETKLVKK